MWTVCGLALLGAAALFARLSPALAGGHADARFRGTGRADPIRIANVRRSDGPAAGQSSITFDLAWDHSWRAAWEVSEEQHGGKGKLKLTGVARASLEELLLDYQDFLRQRGLRLWPKDSPQALAVRREYREQPSDLSDRPDRSNKREG